MYCIEHTPGFWQSGSCACTVKKGKHFVVRSELSDQTAPLDEALSAPALESRSEDRTRWLHFADVALGPKMKEVLARARREQEAIQRKIRPHIAKFKKSQKP